MRIKVKFLVDTHGFKAGEERNFRPSVAMGLIKGGFAEEISTVVVATVTRKPISVESVPVVAEVTELIEAVEAPKPKRTRKKKDDNSSNTNV